MLRLPLRLPLLRGSRLGAATRLQHGVTFGKQSSIYDDEHLFPDHVHEEEKTGIKAGLPMPRDAELWKTPNDPSLLVRTALARAQPPSSRAAASTDIAAARSPSPCLRHSSQSVLSYGGMMALRSPSGLWIAAAPVAPTAAARGR